MILVTNQDFVIHPLIKTKLPYDPFKSFTPVTLVATAPEVLAVSPSLPARTMQELIALIKASPGRYNYATPGFGTSPHLANERLFKLTHGLNVVHVPFQGAPPAVAATIAGDTQIIHITLPLIAPHIRSGKLRALAIAATNRAPEFLDLPTLTEAGIVGERCFKDRRPTRICNSVSRILRRRTRWPSRLWDRHSMRRTRYCRGCGHQSHFRRNARS